jgi:sialic acid synthase SpsE
LSTPLDLASADFLADIVDAFKIASGDNNFYPLIERACASGKPIIVSSGLSDLAQIQRTKAFVETQWKHRSIQQQMAVLHCVSCYPTPPEQVNLASIPYMARELGCIIGYSDHMLGIDASLYAIAAGARIIEKHFTLDKNFSSFRDHQLSADPADMKQLVAQVKHLSSMVGMPEKVVQSCEAAGVPLIRRSIVAGAELPAGHTITLHDLLWLRPGDGIAPGREDEFIGRTLRRTVSFGEALSPADVE